MADNTEQMITIVNRIAEWLQTPEGSVYITHDGVCLKGAEFRSAESLREYVMGTSGQTPEESLISNGEPLISFLFVLMTSATTLGTAVGTIGYKLLQEGAALLEQNPSLGYVVKHHEDGSIQIGIDGCTVYPGEGGTHLLIGREMEDADFGSVLSGFLYDEDLDEEDLDDASQDAAVEAPMVETPIGESPTGDTGSIGDTA